MTSGSARRFAFPGMKIAFVRPHLMDRRSSDAMEPLAFAALAALTPPDCEVELFDERLEPIPAQLEADLVALSVETFTARRAYQLAARWRRAGHRVVMGGFHPSFLPEEALAFADSVVVGDADGVWPQVLSDARSGTLKPLYRGPRAQSLAGVRFDRSLFANKGYKKIALVQYGRGCRYACDFCAIRAFYNHPPLQRPTAEVVAELEPFAGRTVFFVDDNLFNDVPSAMRLCEALIPLKLRWACQASIDLTRSPKLLDLMAESGCFGAVVGIESLAEENLRQMRKAWNIGGGTYRDSIRQFHDRGIILMGSFVFGYDHDTVETFERTADFAIESRLALVNFNTLTPAIGSRFFRQLQREGRLVFQRWWLDPRYRYGDATFHPRGMSADELTQGCTRIRKRFYRYRSILERALLKANREDLTRLAVFLAGNLINRQEHSAKLGQRLGDATPLEPALEHEPVDTDASGGLLGRGARQTGE